MDVPNSLAASLSQYCIAWLYERWPCCCGAAKPERVIKCDFIFFETFKYPKNP